MKKLTNANYLHDVPTDHPAVNEQNRKYINRFVSENYERLNAKFKTISNNINSSGFDSLDKLNETLLSLYTDPDLCFTSWEEAKRYLTNKFTEKEIRVAVKKPEKSLNEEIN